MQDFTNVLFQRGWFGPTALMLPAPPCEEEVELPEGAYNEGPLDGPFTESMHAQWFAPMPVVNPAQMSGPVFCRPGFAPVPTGVPGQSKCVPFEPPSQMVGGPQGLRTVNSPVRQDWPSRTFPVRPYYGWQQV